MPNIFVHAATRVAIALSVSAFVACGQSPDRTMPSHRAGVEAWQTAAVAEQGRDLHVTVTARPGVDPVAVASRIVEQRRDQGWQTIRVTIQEHEGQRAERTVVARHPYRPADITAQ